MGGVLGAGVGLATAVGMIPVVGPILAAGPLVSALGLGAGALGTTAAGALTGAGAGGVVGALATYGVGEPAAQKYEDRVKSGDILVATHADESVDTAKALEQEGATDVNIYSLRV